MSNNKEQEVFCHKLNEKSLHAAFGILLRDKTELTSMLIVNEDTTFGELCIILGRIELLRQELAQKIIESREHKK